MGETEKRSGEETEKQYGRLTASEVDHDSAVTQTTFVGRRACGGQYRANVRFV